jgi:DNA-binding NarL/FixJ family response regulator
MDTLDHVRGAPDVRAGANVRHVAIIERRRFFRDCLARALSTHPALDAKAFGTVAEFIEEGAPEGASIVILCVQAMSPEEAARELSHIAEACAEMPVLVLAQEHEIVDSVTSGACGYIPASMQFEAAVEAILAASSGPARPAVRETGPMQDASGWSAITSRETMVIDLLRRGRSNKAIARELDISEATVKVHLRHVMRKLRATNRTEVAIRWNGFLSRHDGDDAKA